MNKKAILAENVIFIVLNLVFFSILLIFIYLQSSPTTLLEQETAKQIALLIDAAKPEILTEIKINVEEVVKKAEENEINEPIVIDKTNNLVIVKLTEKSSYDYAFFNDVDIEDRIIGDWLEMKIK